MSDPQRMLFDGGTSDVEREMLRAWAGVRASDEARKKTLVALGMAATGAATAGLAAGAGKVAGGSIAPKAAGLGAAALLKWIALGVVVTGATAATLAYVGREKNTPAPLVAATSVAPQVAATAASAMRAAPPDAPPSAVPTVDVMALPLAPSATPPVVASAPAAKSDSLAEQLAALDRARAALRAGDFAGAARLVDRYEADFPRGAFTQEAEVVRIDALYGSGNRAAAESAARRFVATYPSSPHAPRMRALFGIAQP